MKEYKKTYKLANITIELILPFEYEDLEEYKLYRVDTKTPQISIHFIEKDYSVDTNENTFSIEYNKVTRIGAIQYFELLAGDFQTVYGCLVIPDGEKHHFTCYLKKNARKNLPYATQVFKAISIDHMLNCYGAYILHASYIRWNGKGILFSAPSGTGKTTQAELWEEYCGAEIINGDRAILKKEEETWKAFGLPYAGSSGVFKNITTELGAVVILRQDTVNRLTRLYGSQAIHKLYAESIVHTWDKIYLENLMDMLVDIVKAVPIYLLECRPDESSVMLLKERLEKEKIWH